MSEALASSTSVVTPDILSADHQSGGAVKMYPHAGAIKPPSGINSVRSLLLIPRLELIVFRRVWCELTKVSVAPRIERVKEGISKKFV